MAGLAVGAGLGLARSAGWRPAPIVSGLAAALGALVGTNGPMTVMGVTDPRTWAVQDWVSDVIPHVAYGACRASTLAGTEHRRPSPAQLVILTG